MKIFFLTSIILVVAAQQCRKDKASGIPLCIQQKIDSIKREPRWNPPAEVREYSYKGRRVFYFTANCCDQYHVLYDENCNYVCAPSGGFTGRGDRACPEFSTEAKLVKVVWKDER